MSLLFRENDPLAPLGQRRSLAFSPGDILSGQLETKQSSNRESETGGWFDLSAPVGREASNRHQDVLKVESLLGQTGHYAINRLQGPTGLWGGLADRAVKDFQRENGLKVDGILNPGGPTIAALQRRTGDIFKYWTPPSYQDVVDHHNGLADGGSGRLTFGVRPCAWLRPWGWRKTP